MQVALFHWYMYFHPASLCAAFNAVSLCRLQVLAQLEEVKSSVRDPYSRQTRLTLTRMIRKKAAENKRITAELQRVQVRGRVKFSWSWVRNLPSFENH